MASSTPGLSSKPTVQAIVEDVRDCVENLKSEYNDFSKPITDDSKILQRFCVKLEFLMRHEIIEKSSFLGGRKDYWNYFIEVLSSVKGVTDGLKFVKSHNELKTNVGRGRGFIRFCLMYQRLADCMQLCVSNTKLTSQWYRQASVWRNGTQSNYLISVLYDLNDVTFDLGAHGYDLDNGWPTFSRSDLSYGGAQKWNLSMSRSSSISNLSQSGLPPPGSPWMSSSFVDGRVVHVEESDEHYRTCLTDPDPASTDNQDSENEKLIITQLTEDNSGLKAEKEELEKRVKYLQSQVDTLSSSDSQKQSHIGDMEKRLMELEQRNSQLVENLQQLAQDKSSTASSHIDNLIKIQGLMTRHSESDTAQSEARREADQLKFSLKQTEDERDTLNTKCAESTECISHLTEDKTNLEEQLSTIANSLMEKSQLLEKFTESHNEEKGRLNNEKTTLQSQLEEACACNAQLEIKLAALQNDYDNVNHSLSCLNSANKEMELTQTATTDLTVQLDSQLQGTRAKHETSLKDLEQVTKELRDAQTKLELLSADLEKESLLNKQLTERANSTAEQLSHSLKVNSDLSKQLQSSQQTVDQLNTDTKALTVQLSESQKKAFSMQESVTSQDTLCNQLLSELSETQSAHSKLEQSYKSLQTDYSTLQTKNTKLCVSVADLSDQASKSEDDLHKKLEESQTRQSELLSEIEVVTSSRREMEDALLAQASELETANNQVTRLDSEMNTLRATLRDTQTSLEKSEAETAALQQQSHLQNQQVEGLEQQLVNIHTSHDQLQQAKQELEESYEELKLNYQALDEEREEQRVGLSEIEQELSTLREEHHTLQETLLVDLSEQQQGTLKISMEYDRLTSLNSELHVEVTKARQDLESANRERATLLAKLEQEAESKQALTDDLNQLKAEITTLKSRLKSLKTEEMERSKELTEVSCRLETTKLELSNRQTVMEQQIGALRFQLSSQQMEADLALQGYKEQQEEVQKMCQTISTQERIIAAIEIQLDSLQDGRDVESLTHQQRLDELFKLLDEKETELICLSDELDGYRNQFAALTDANESMTESIIQLKLGATEQQAKNENELHQLREDNTILKKRLVKLIKDKDSLWQTTDALIFKQKKLNDVKWMDDGKVLNCMGCRSTFSLLLRKHHCRLCGRIFCWQCSNNWLDTTASSKKSRACNQCFIEHSQALPESLNTSSLTSDGDTESLSLPVEINSRNWTSHNHSLTLSPESDTSSRLSSAVDPAANESTHNNIPPQSKDEHSVREGSDPPSDISTDPNRSEDMADDETPPAFFQSPTSNDAMDETEADDQAVTSLPAEPITSQPAEPVSSFPVNNGPMRGEDDFDEITEEEIARSVGRSPPIMSFTPTVKSDDRYSPGLMESLRSDYSSVFHCDGTKQGDTSPCTATTTLEVNHSHTVCVIVDKENTNLAWKFNSTPKALHFSLTYKTVTEDKSSYEGEKLIPECKCNSHRQQVQGEMISHNCGLYIFSFINKSNKLISMDYEITTNSG